MNSRLKRTLSLFLSFFLIVSLLPAFSLADEAEEAPPPGYSVQVSPTEHGSLSAAPQSASPGETVTLTAVPENGYEIAAVYVDDEPLSPVEGVYSFIMPEKDVTASAVFRQQVPLLASQEGNGEQEENNTDAETDEPDLGGMTLTSTSGTEYIPVEGYTVPANMTVSTSAGYPWALYNGTQTLVCGNSQINSSLSLLKVTVTGPGTLNFQYRVYSSTTETAPDSLLISVGTEIPTNVSYSTFSGQRYYGETGWQNGAFVLETAENEVTDIYFAYRKNGSGSHTIDAALLKGITFSNGRTMVTAAASDPSFGTVTGGGEYIAGNTVTLTAQPAEGAKLFGWIHDGLWQDTDETSYSFVAGADTTVTALLGSGTDTVAQNRTTGLIYTSVKAAIDAASVLETIVLVKDAVIEDNVTIPAHVTLYVPYCALYDADGNADGTTANFGSMQATEAETFRRLTINSGASLDIKGKLLIGGIIGYPSQLYQGHTSGAHGRITNNGVITVSGGQIDCYGYIDGTGTLEAVTGNVFEPFIVLDFAGGNNLAQLYLVDQNSFRDYTMQNISCTMVIHSAAALNAYCNLWASSQYNKTKLAIIGGESTAPQGLIVLENGAKATRTVDKSKYLSGAVASGTYGADLGKVTYTLSGGGILNYLSIDVGIRVSVTHFPIPYSYKYILTNGSYSMPTGWDIMPGAEFTVEQGATLYSSGRLFVLDGLKCGNMSGKSYPSSETLAMAGYPTCGVLTVNGRLYFNEHSIFGGIVQTNGTGSVSVSNSTTVINSRVQFGAVAYYDDNTCIMPLNGRIYIGDELVNMTPGTLYTAEKGDVWTLPHYTILEYATDNTTASQPSGGKYGKPQDTDSSYVLHAENENVMTNQTMYGSYYVSGNVDEFIIINKTYYDPNDNSRAIVSPPAVASGTATFTVVRTEAGKSYNFLVQYSVNGGTPVTVQADKTTGNYIIPDSGGTVTFTVIAVQKGDVNLNGKVAANDVTLLRRVLAKYTTFEDELQAAAADCSGNGSVAANDVTLLRRYLAKYISEL